MAKCAAWRRSVRDAEGVVGLSRKSSAEAIQASFRCTVAMSSICSDDTSVFDTSADVVASGANGEGERASASVCFLSERYTTRTPYSWSRSDRRARRPDRSFSDANQHKAWCSVTTSKGRP